MSEHRLRLKNLFQEIVSPAEFKCVSCGADVFDESGFCSKCLQKVIFNNGKTCLRCGVALRGEENYCGNCAFEKVYFDRAYSPFSYEGTVQKAILQMKFFREATNAKVLARYLVQVATQHNLQFDVVTFVPMTARAQKQRGYNQAQLLAKHFCAIMEANVPQSLLTKMKDTERQEKLDKQARKDNLIGAFAADSTAKGKNVLLIDDIKTTGTTLNECAKVLKQKGALSVVCLTVASREEHFAYELQSKI